MSGQTLLSNRFMKKHLKHFTEPIQCPLKHISYKLSTKLSQNSLITQLFRQPVVSQSRPTLKIHTLLTLESELKQQLK